MRRAFRKDSTEKAIRQRAEAMGFLWLENTATTKGRPDACLLRGGETFWCEVKTPNEPFTKAQLTEFPRIVAKGVPVYVLEHPDDVVHLMGGNLRPWAPSDATPTSTGRGSRAKKPRVHKPGVSRARRINEMCWCAGCVRSVVPGTLWCETHTADATPASPMRQSSRRKK